jgi:hypothetical protein
MANRSLEPACFDLEPALLIFVENCIHGRRASVVRELDLSRIVAGAWGVIFVVELPELVSDNSRRSGADWLQLTGGCRSAMPKPSIHGHSRHFLP